MILFHLRYLILALSLFLLTTAEVLGQDLRSPESWVQSAQGSDFSIVVERERDSVLFVFHQQDLLIHSDHSLFPYIKQVHEGSQFFGYVLDYDIHGLDYSSILSDESNRNILTSRDIAYFGNETYQAEFFANRSMILRVRNKVRRKESFSLAVLSDTGWHGGVFDMVLDQSTLLNLASENSFTLCSLLNDVSFFERGGSSLRGFGDESVSDALKEIGLSCTTDFELVQASPAPPPSDYTNSGANEPRLLQAASGTAFAVTSDGVLVTNNHVIEGCEDVRVHTNGSQAAAKVLSRDPGNDLALIKVDFHPTAVFPLATGDLQILEEIYVAGYPFGENLSSSVKVTKGIVSSLTGLGNNFSNIQIDAAIQPGNSGGPIFDEQGNVRGVAVATLDIQYAIERFDTIPQNTNFGIKANIVSNMLSSNGLRAKGPNTQPMSTTQLGTLATDATYFLSCWMTREKMQEMSSSRVLFRNIEQ